MASTVTFNGRHLVIPTIGSSDMRKMLYRYIGRCGGPVLDVDTAMGFVDLLYKLNFMDGGEDAVDRRVQL
jgi:hypothetical protein